MLANHETSLAAAALMKAQVPLPDMYLGMSHDTGISATTTGRRRFGDEQIKSLQFIFRTEPRPEPRIMQQLADQLGLHPRQVATWFQNRRARSKSKRMMRDYCVLKANYDALASDVESLKRENCSLHLQLQQLRDILDGSQAGKARW